MISVSQRLARQLPNWARRSNPALRYELGEPPKRSAAARYLRGLMVVLGLMLLGFAVYAIATGLFAHDAGTNPLEAL